MGNIGNLSGIGKMENGGSKLYCVTIDNIYRFYSYTPINDTNNLMTYLNAKGTIPAFGARGSTGATYYIVDEARSIEYYTETSFIVRSVRIKGNYSSKQYQGGEFIPSIISYVTYASISTIVCVEV